MLFFEFYASDCIFFKNLFTLVERKSKARPEKSIKKLVLPLLILCFVRQTKGIYFTRNQCTAGQNEKAEQGEQFVFSFCNGLHKNFV
ncbi:MAG TPA: hypothetical protein DHW64_00090 [Chitinophagaceae bacterium]|nr:hypothetical protein [Chitinophagaceae bacterium]